jgi:oligopeptide/dipeptide ABC transporter ATP-binding protein
MSGDAPLLEVEGLRKWFPVREGLVVPKTVGHVRAVDDVSFSIRRGEVLALVGESGSGKSTTGRLVLRLLEPTAGSVRFDGTDLLALGKREMRAIRRRMQIVFQDPFSSLNPHLRVDDMLEEALVIHDLDGDAAGRRARVAELLGIVGLRPEYGRRFPHEFSGGQRQRLAIARALAVRPDFIVADEPVSALDVSIQAQIVNLLQELQQRLGIALLFIAHDLGVVRHVATRVAVMYLGRIVEMGDAEQVFGAPAHPYTEALISAIPVPDPDAQRRRIILGGEIPSPMSPPSGCVFRTRCRYATDACAQTVPVLEERAPGHAAACLLPELPRAES